MRSILAVAALAALGASEAHAQRLWTCSLHQGPESWTGECIGPNAAVVGIHLRYDRDASPPWNGSWLDPERPLELGPGVYGGIERLLIRDDFTWYFVDTWKVDRDTATLVFDALNQAPPNEVDLAIVDHALEMLSSTEVWDRQDDRDCDNDSGARISVYCAFAAGTVREMGRAYHRLPAMRVARDLIIRQYPDRVEGHPLMDFNNHPATTLDEVRRLLSEVRGLARAEVLGGDETALLVLIETSDPLVMQRSGRARVVSREVA